MSVSKTHVPKNGLALQCERCQTVQDKDLLFCKECETWLCTNCMSYGVNSVWPYGVNSVCLDCMGWPPDYTVGDNES